MRVISGKYRGLMVDGFQIAGTRPTMDRVKESMFAMIQEYIKGSCVLDLFAGSGNLGIEAMSNGSQKTYFVDSNRIATKYIAQNLKRMRVSEDYQILQKDYRQALQYFHKANIRFDVVFLDPPYRFNFINEVLVQLLELELLNDRAIIVCEYDQEEVLNDRLICLKNRAYHDKYVTVYQYQKNH